MPCGRMPLQQVEGKDFPRQRVYDTTRNLTGVNRDQSLAGALGSAERNFAEREMAPEKMIS